MPVPARPQVQEEGPAPDSAPWNAGSAQGALAPAPHTRLVTGQNMRLRLRAVVPRKSTCGSGQEPEAQRKASTRPDSLTPAPYLEASVLRH